MNKIFIIGNGFDLAHGLPTSYNHFIDNFWKKIKSSFKEKEIKNIVCVNESYSGFLNFNPINNYDDIILNISEHSKEYGYKYDENYHQYFTDNSRSISIFKFENDFFKKLNIFKTINNWVDVENLYYYELKKITKLKKRTDYETEDELLNYKKGLVVKLNKEFEQVKELFINYMEEEVINRYDFGDKIGSRYWRNYYDFLMPFSVYNDNSSSIGFEFTDKNDVKELENLYLDQKGGDFINSAMFLCFNYTPTINSYLSFMKKSNVDIKLNYIHNEILEKKSSIIFGFGDEMDEDYKFIENINDNEYLKNFKSFQYLQYSNYNNLLNYINYNKYQVCILGHSCGLSDRVLLNTIFEHENCRSIKVFYHKSDKGDNYLDLLQNISRHFNSKSLMRERVVNKDFSVPMVQIQIPKKD